MGQKQKKTNKQNAISAKFEIDGETISTDFPLNDFLHRQNRRTMVTELERFLGVKLNILRQPHWVTLTFLILFVVSLLS